MTWPTAPGDRHRRCGAEAGGDPAGSGAQECGHFQEYHPEIARRNRDAILLIVSNPVDVLTWRRGSCPATRPTGVLGSGTVLDTARFKYILGEHLGVDPRNVHARIIGEHGDSEIAAWSTANISGIPVNDFCELRAISNTTSRCSASPRREEQRLRDHREEESHLLRHRHRPYKDHKAILGDEHSVLTVSAMLRGEYGQRDVYTGVPCIINQNGVQRILPLSLMEGELEKLEQSCKVLRESFEGIF